MPGQATCQAHCLDNRDFCTAQCDTTVTVTLVTLWSHVTQRDVVTREREEQGDYRLQITVAEERGEEY